MSRLIHIDADQRSESWRIARLGRLTGSVSAQAFAKSRDKKTWGTGRRNLMLRLVLERVTGKTMEREFQSDAMATGVDREPLAFAAYEALTGEVVQRTGFLAMSEHMAGCSLDGHIGDFARLLSIKCRQPAAHLDFLRSGTIPNDSLTQMRHEMWVTGANEHEYMSFQPDFPARLQVSLVLLKRKDSDINKYEDEALTFLSEVKIETEALLTMSDPAGRLAAAVTSHTASA